MQSDSQELTSRLLTDVLLSRCHSPEEVTEALASLHSLDYLDWEELIEQRRIENRVYRVFIPCPECHIISNRESWVLVKRKTGGADSICYDCTRKLKPHHMYTCAWCEKEYLSLSPQQENVDVCSRHHEHWALVRKHLRRAELVNLPATLTVSQWRAAVHHFDQMCAYCTTNPYAGMEHYLPLSLGGGTTADNCLPSCGSCNNRKNDKHPDEFARMFTAENMRRIRQYLKG